MILGGEDKQQLLGLARRAIEVRLLGSGPQVADTPTSPALVMSCGAFVSLYVEGKLRGCIGTFREDMPLYRVVDDMALAAATCDSRFSPIGRQELAFLDIEISVLTPRKRIGGPSEIVIGKHGIYMKCGQRTGTLLPQVAVSQGWTAEEFLENCAKRKAGLHPTDWKHAELFAFEALVFRSG